MTGWLDPAPVGARVLVRAPVAGDETALAEMAADPEVRRFVGGAIDAVTAAAKAASGVSEPAWGRFVIADRDTGDAVGSGDLARKRGPWEISYQLRRSWWGRGLATEAVTLMVEWFFTHTAEDLLIATTQRSNVRSRRVLERAGATFAGTFTQYGAVQDRFEFRRRPGRAGHEPDGGGQRPPSGEPAPGR